MIPSTLRELARIAALEEMVDSANATIYKLTTELDSERQRCQQLVTECDRLRAIAGAQDEYATGGYVRLDSKEDFHRVIGDGD